MATVTVEVDIDIEEHLDEVFTSDLIDELERRSLAEKEMAQLKKLTGVKSQSLLDDLKLQIVLKGIEDKSINQLEKFFK
ncbi:hypothetical protein [Tenacibaculum soleae]|uniref:hypothetical protein n=1 Tax=Tenacibaculum soleae TaxID=447689 RepID=UPI002301E0FA|nr:hypothetical protein [Tenacibaculum soleae]